MKKGDRIMGSQSSVNADIRDIITDIRCAERDSADGGRPDLAGYAEKCRADLRRILREKHSGSGDIARDKFGYPLCLKGVADATK